MISEQAVYQARCKINDFFHGKDPMKTVFTKNATEGLNMVIRTLAEMKGHIIYTAYEHNSVIRPLYQYTRNGCLHVDVCLPDLLGCINPQDIESKIRKDTVAVIVSLASNITGYILPVKEIGKICKNHNIFFIVDVSQGAGTLQPDMTENNIHVIVGTGHKDLYGPQGTGFVCTDGFDLMPLLYGGTGTDSMSPDPELVCPDMLEAGTLNLPGITGLARGIDFVRDLGKETILKYKKKLVSAMTDGLNCIKGISTYAPSDNCNCGIVALDIDRMDSQEAVHLLSTKYQICARGGFHCSPNLHRYLKTDQKGLIRFSFGVFNRIREIDHVLNALESIVKSLE